MTFADRSDAGRRLAKALEAYRLKRPVILALPRGGVTVAAEIAAALRAPLDLLIVRKIGVPNQPELAMGAIVDGNASIVVRNEDVIAMAGVAESTFAEIRDRELTEIHRRRERYLGRRPHPELTGHTVIVVDDGIATGATMRAALLALRRREPAFLVMAVPVAPPSTLTALRGEVDEIVCLKSHEGLGAIGYYYADFEQVTDAEVIAALNSAPPPEPAMSARP